MTAKTDFVRLKFRWIESIGLDPRLSKLAIRVAIKLSSHLNSGDGTARPSIDLIARDLHADRRHVQHAVRELESLGYLRVIIGGGRNTASRYIPIHETAPPAPPFSARERAAKTDLKGGKNTHETAPPAPPEPLVTLNEPSSTAASPPTDYGKTPQKKKNAERNGPRTISALANPQVRKSGLSEPAGTPLGKPKPATMEAEEWFALAPEDGEPSPRILAYDEFKKAPLKALDIDIQIGRFKEYNAGKRLLPDQWRDLWQRWCVQAVVHAKQYAA
jgi:hypothetical protein